MRLLSLGKAERYRSLQGGAAPGHIKRYFSVMDSESDRYVVLLKSFVRGDLDAPSFAQQFLLRWKADRDAGVTTGDAIDDLMTGVDCYDEKPDVVLGIGAEELRSEAAQALRRLSTQ